MELTLNGVKWRTSGLEVLNLRIFSYQGVGLKCPSRHMQKALSVPTCTSCR